MKKFTLVSLVAAAAFATTAAFSASNVFAADTTKNDAPTTTGTIGLNATTDGQPSNGSNDLPVELKSAPSVDFGNKTLNTAADSYTAETVSAPIEVLNPGIATPWTVSAEATEFTDSTTNTVLKGAVLTMSNPDVSINNGKATQSAAANANTLTFPTTAAITAFSSAATVKDEATGETKTQGVGTNDATFSKENVKLDVPAGNVQGSYTSNITWTLTNSVATTTGTTSSDTTK